MNNYHGSHGAGIELRGVRKIYGDPAAPAVDNVSLNIAPGEFITFLGPSGSGKTTTLNMIAGFAGLDGGTIVIDGKDVSDLKPYKRNLGVVFQNYALFPHMTVAKNVAFPLEQRRVPKREIARRVEEALALVQLSGYGSRLPKQLSGGQQQRVALARALVFSPSVLLMDEPFGALDKKLRDELQQQVSRIHAELGVTFVFVTHDQEEALVLSDRIAVFNQGRIEQVGTAEDLYERPQTRFVAEFIGESNIYTQKLGPDGVCLDCGPQMADVANGCGIRGNHHETVMIRPEHVRVCLEENRVTALHEHKVHGVVRDVSYYGAFRRLRVQVGLGHYVIAVESAGASSKAVQGSRVSLTWETLHAVPLPQDGAPQAVTLSGLAADEPEGLTSSGRYQHAAS